MPAPRAEAIASKSEPLTQAPPFSLKVKVEVETIVIPEKDGRYSVIVPAFPGCCSVGETLEEVQANIVEAAEGWLETLHEARCDQALRGAIE
jgi:predicted RNase H-like HicB family nuclease